MEIGIMKFTSEDKIIFGHLFSRMHSRGWGFWAVLVVAGSFVAAGVITACSDDKSKQAGAVSYESAPCPRPNLPGFPEADLGPNYSCGYLTVPENRSKPDGPTIRIAVARVRAVAAVPEPDPIVYLAGGPGGSGLVSAIKAVADGMNAERDVIFVDQRGAYHADPRLACPEIDAFIMESMRLPFSDPATADLSDAATRRCRDRLADEGLDLAAYNSIENAADIADLRLALGIREWNVYGVSYGTNLALRLLRDHPDGIRSVVLDSVAPPNLNLITEWWLAAASGYRAIFDACAEQPACAASFPNLEAEFIETVIRLNTTPIVVSVPNGSGESIPVNIDGFQLANLVVLTSLETNAYAGIPSMIHALATGDGREAAARLLDAPSPAGITGYGLQYGVFCREWANWTTADEVKTRAKAALPGFPDEVLDLLPVLPRIFADCAIWDVGAAGADDRAPVHSDMPVLIMNGTFDADTPVYYADAVTPGLTRAQVVPIPGVGHHVTSQSACARSLMAAFFDQPGRAVDDTCADEMGAPTFITP